jgi:c-di-GMP-binding flagellar brake protein YcgR
MILLHKKDIAVGKPLPWPVYDADSNVLLGAGLVIESKAQLDGMLSGHRTLYRPTADWRPPAAPAVQPKPDVASEERSRRFDFDELHLAVGTRLQLQRLDQDENARYSTRLFGYIKDVSVMVSTPTQGGKLLLLREGQPVVVRAFSGTDAFAFTAPVLTARFAPDPYLHLAYPPYVTGAVIRRQRRVDIKLIAAISVPGQGEAQASIPARITDLSAGGARLRARTPIGEPDSPLAVSFRLQAPNGEATLTMRAVIRTAATEEGGQHIYGVQFVDMSPLDALALEGYVVRQAEKDAEEE